MPLSRSGAPFAEWAPPDQPACPTTDTLESATQQLSLEETPAPGTGEQPEQDDETKSEEPAPGVRIQVSARHLILGSPVFEKMLTGNWSEGKQLKEQGSVELEVDSWDIDALLAVLNILHSFLLKVPREVSLEQLAKIAVVANYYDCKAVQFFANQWFTESMKDPPRTYSRDMVLGLWVSYFFGDEVAFRNYTSTIIYQSDFTISALGLPIPGQIIGDMNDAREGKLRHFILETYKVRDSLLDERLATDSFCSNSDCRSIMLGTLIRHMKLYHLDLVLPQPPYIGLKFAELKGIASISSPFWVSLKDNLKKDPKDRHENSPFRSSYHSSYEPFDPIRDNRHKCSVPAFQHLPRPSYERYFGLDLAKYSLK